MKPYEFKSVYHPRLGRFVYKHKGSGIIIGSIFKPMMAFLAYGQKSTSSGVSQAGDRIGKTVAEKSGDLIMKQLSKIRQGSTKHQKMMPIQPIRQQEETTNMGQAFWMAVSA